MAGFTGFADFTHNSVPHVPASSAMPLVALYATGSVGVEATAADIAKYRAVHTGVAMIDQTPSLALFRAGTADIADVEFLAGTVARAADGVIARQAHGWMSTLYVSLSGLAGLQNALHPGTDHSKVFYGVADYSWSLAQAEAQLNSHPNWAYVQYGDPESNPGTVIPGTPVTLRAANADIDVATASWASWFTHHPAPAKPPAPVPPVPESGVRRIAPGGKSLAQLAAERGGDAANMLELTLRSISAADKSILLHQPLPNGWPYYTFK